MIRLTFLGDIMCDYSMASKFDKYLDQNGNYSFHSSFAYLKPLLDRSDYVFANLETPISKATNSLTQAKWEFNSPIQFAEAVKNNGVNYVSTANNHCMDRGFTGLVDTIHCLDEIGLDHGGTQIGKEKTYSIIQVGDTKIGILAYTYGTNAFSNHQYLSINQNKSINLLQEQEGRVKQIWSSVFHGHLIRLYDLLEKILFPDNKGKMPYERRTISCFRKRLIRKTLMRIKQEKPDIIISYLHIGGQYNKEPSEYTKSVSNWFINHGCDIVIDNHEHVIHGIEYTKKRKLIAYALGNCLGSVGVTREPFDRLSQYSIALHVEFESKTKSINKVTYSILKTILNDIGQYEVHPCSDLYQKYNCEEKEKLKKDVSQIIELISKEKTSVTSVIKNEYSII